MCVDLSLSLFSNSPPSRLPQASPTPCALITHKHALPPCIGKKTFGGILATVTEVQKKAPPAAAMPPQAIVPTKSSGWLAPTLLMGLCSVWKLSLESDLGVLFRVQRNERSADRPTSQPEVTPAHHAMPRQWMGGGRARRSSGVPAAGVRRKRCSGAKGPRREPAHSSLLG